jgi:uncharacterized protein (TIGR03000 family)
MPRLLPALAAFFASLALLLPVVGQEPAGQSVQLRVLLPEGDAHLLIDGKKTKQTGIQRHYYSPPLEAGWTYTYTLTATWEPNNYTEVIRRRIVHVKAGQDVVVDLRKPDAGNPDKFQIRYVPTPDDVVEAMCKLAKVGKNDIVYDLGCGDGRIVITAVKDFGAKRGVGVDLSEKLVRTSQREAAKAKVGDRVVFRQQDVLDIKDLSDASVVMMYMGEDVNLRLMPILKKSLKAGSRIVSHDFKMGDWRPDQKITMFSDEDGDDHVLYLWTIK